jgi:branched-chain amino acid transport system substrate-binding protein
MKSKKVLSLGLVFVVICLWTMSVADGAEKVRGVTKDTIRLGMSFPLTGPAAFPGRQGVEAVKAYTNYINDTGGIHGRKIVLIIDDSQFVPSIALGIFKKQVTNDDIFAQLAFGSPPNIVLIQPAMEEKIPVSISGADKPYVIPTNKYVFCYSTPSQIQAATCLTYIHDVLKKKDVKIAVFWRNDPFGKSVLEGVKGAASYYQYDVVAEPSFVPFQSIEFSSDVMAIKRAKAEFVIIGASIGDLSGFLREAKNQGLEATMFGANIVCSDRKIIQQAGEAAENYLSICGATMFRETNIPGVKKMLEVSNKYAPKDILAEESFYYTQLYTHYMQFVDALKLAGPDPTQENYVTATEKIKNFTGDGLGPLTSYSATKHYSSDASFIGRVDMKIKDFQRVSDWIAPPQEVINKVFK